MDVKELNKSQLIMLALLLSFVTSIATGITTVTLMQQAPASVTVPINRIVRQTVEKIVPGETTNTVQTVVIKEEDLVVDAIAKNQAALFSISKEGLNETGETVEISAGKGLAISTDGIIVVDAALVPDKGVYYVKNDSGKFKADFLSTDKLGFSFLKIGAPLDEKNKLTYTVPTFGDLNKMKIGQKIIVLGSSISSFIFDGSNDLKLSGAKSNAGAPVLDLDGNVLGIALSGDTASFVQISNITDALKSAIVPIVKAQ
ncbi:MAG: S1C family serine protease [bacterium]